MRILWIDDHIYESLEPSVGYLERHGIQVGKAKNVSEALLSLRLDQPDGIILDVVFPDESGMDVLVELKHLYPGIPIVICTSVPKLKDQFKALVDQGAAFYIDKADAVPPLDIDSKTEFLDVLSRLFDGANAQVDKVPNSGWLVRRETKTCVIFLHGFFSDNVSCWTSENGDAEVYWPDLVSRDPHFSDCSIFLSGFYTGPDSGTYSTRDASRDVFFALDREQSGQASLLDSCENIIFVCHSTGGVVIRHMLVNNYSSFAAKKVGLVLLASPSYGSVFANRLGLVARLYRNSLALELKKGGAFLRELDASFKDLITDAKIPFLCGAEAIESKPIFTWKWVPSFMPKVVDSESGGRYFGNSVQIAETDHFTIAKPNGTDHDSHLFLADFYTKNFLKG